MLMHSSKISFLALLLLLSYLGHSQTYFANGSARSLGNGCYKLTDAADWQLGSVWYADKLDLKKDFDLEFDLNFGTKDDGADGIVFVMQTLGNKALGVAGGGIGFEGFSPSLGVEFDDWDNTNFGDLSSDHIAIFKNGSVDHKSNNALTDPVSALANSGNIEDGQNHLVRITWNASLKLFEVWFDCVKRQSITLDIENTIFKGESLVYWGFTSATGGSNNNHVVCLRDDILTQDTFYVCQGEKIELNTRESDNNDYVWTPNLYLSDNTLQNPICSSTVPITYFVNYTDKCGNKLTDTIHVGVVNKPDLGDLEDISLCADEKLNLNIDNEYGTVLWNGRSRESFELLNYEGTLSIKSSNSCGADSTDLEVSVIDCTCDLWFPNVFTPNKDGLNDEFGPVDICSNLKEYNLSVYNRWGEKVFEANDLSEFWDGSRNKKQSVDGVYFWVAKWIGSVNGQEVETLVSGSLDLIR